MNKYKEAFDELKEVLYLPDKYLEKRLNILQELVEKATPQKPVRDYDVELDGTHLDFNICPNCHSELGDEIYNNCQWCGQAIDGRDLENPMNDIEWL